MPGTVAKTHKKEFEHLTRSTFLWVADGSGDVSANALHVSPGEIRQVKFIPDGGGTQPDAAYDVLLKDEDGVDLLQAAGDNLSDTLSTISVPAVRFVHDGSQKLDLVVANAGASNGGTVILWTGRVR